MKCPNCSNSHYEEYGFCGECGSVKSRIVGSVDDRRFKFLGCMSSKFSTEHIKLRSGVPGILTCGDNFLREWSLPNLEQVRRVEAKAHRIISWTPDGYVAAVEHSIRDDSSYNCDFQLTLADMNSFVSRIHLHYNRENDRFDYAVLPNGDLVLATIRFIESWLSGSRSLFVDRLCIRSGSCTQMLKERFGDISKVQLVASGYYLSIWLDGKKTCWDCSAGSMRRLQCPPDLPQRNPSARVLHEDAIGNIIGQAKDGSLLYLGFDPRRQSGKGGGTCRIRALKGSSEHGSKRLIARHGGVLFDASTGLIAIKEDGEVQIWQFD